MSRFRPLLAVAAVLLASTVAWAEVPKEYRSPLSRTESLISSCETKLKQVRHDFEAGFHKSRGVQIFERNLGDIADRLGKAKGFAKDFPGDIPELAAMTARIAAFEAELARLQGDLAQDSQGAANENANLSAGLEKDQAAVEAITQLLTDLMGELGTDSRVPESVKAWPRIKADATRLGDSYGSSRASSPEARKMANTVRIMTASLRNAQERVSQFLQTGDSMVGKHLTAAEQDAATAIASRNYDPFQGSIRRSLRAAEILLEQASLLYASGEPGDSTWIKRQKERIAKINAQAKPLFDQIVGRNDLPKEAYSGSDRAAVAAAVSKTWLERNPNSPPAKILFSGGGWNRVSRWGWNDSLGAWQKQDYSSLEVAVVVRSKDGKYGYWYMCHAIKDHLNGNRLSVIANPNEGSQVPADRTVPASKIR